MVEEKQQPEKVGEKPQQVKKNYTIKIIEAKEKEKTSIPQQKIVQIPWVSKYISSKFKSKIHKALKGTALKEQIKLMRFRNQIEKMKLKNQFQRMQMMKKVESLRQQGKLPQFPYKIPMIASPTIGETHIESFVNNDINTAFNADMGHGDELWGREPYFLNNDYYGEDYYGEEDMWTGLGLHGLNFPTFRRGSPLLY